MLDPTKRQELIERLRGKVKRASSNVSTKVEATKGEFKVVLTADRIEQYYRDQHVNTIRTAQFDDELVELINLDAQEAAQEILEEFASSYVPPKTAANAVVDNDTAQKVTQKQLEEANLKLHPRTDEFPSKITDRQLVDDGQRPGTYDVITQGQLQETDKTFYNKPLVHDPKDEDRNRVTESQFDEGTKEYSEKGLSDRDRMGADFSGGLDKQHVMVEEKQIQELLNHHEWKEPRTITEGKDQLQKQDGELARLSAADAAKLVKEALSCLARTVVAGSVTPTQLVEISKRLLSHNSKYAPVSDIINNLKNVDISNIHEKIAKAQYFGKFASAAELPASVVAGMLLKQLANVGFDSRHVVKAMLSLNKRDDLAARIHAAVEEVMNTPIQIKQAGTEPDEFDQVFAEATGATVEGTADDGMYQFSGGIDEVDEKFASGEFDDKEFAKAASVFARQQIKEAAKTEVELVAQEIRIDREAGTFEITFKDAAFLTNEEIAKRAETRKTLAKQAASEKVTKEAQFGGPAGGTPMPGGGTDPMQNPAPPPGGADMNAPPPTEALGAPGGPPEEDTEGKGGEPQPPGTVCPSCGSNDVDVESGQFECNNCGAKGDISVRMEVKEWPGTIEESKPEEAGADIEQGLGGIEEEPVAPGGGPEADLGPTPTPIGASVRVTPHLLEKLASQKIAFGTVCPACGSHQTNLAKNRSHGYNGICWECNQEWKMKVKANKKDTRKVYAHFVWIPKTAECNGCTRLATEFRKALNDYGVKWEAFDKLSMVEKAQTVVKMAKSNHLDLSAALMAPLPLQKYAASSRWEGYGQFDKFPTASCIERLSRRFGENATSMSGPCEGKRLAECVCSQLSTLGIYTDGLAAKVASTLASSDPMEHSPSETCVHMLFDAGMTVKEACVACDGLRAAYASTEDLIVEAISNISPPPMKPGLPTAKPMKSSPAPMKPMEAPGAGGGIAAVPAPKPMPAPAPMPGGVAPAAPAPAPMPGGTAPAPAPGEAPAPAPKMMPGGDSPLDIPVDDISVEIEGGPEDELFEGDDLFSGNMDIDSGGEETVQIDVPADIAELIQTIVEALQGQLGGDALLEETPFGGEEGIDDIGEDGSEVGEGLVPEGDEIGEGDSGETLDVSDVTDEVVDEPAGETEGGSEPPPFGEKKEEGGDEKEEKPMLMPEKEDAKLCPKCKSMLSAGKECPCKSKPCMGREEAPVKTANLDQTLYRMKKGTISKTTTAIDNLLDGLIRVADKVKEKPVQDDEDVKPYSNGKTMGNEEKFDAKEPDVPEGDALLGNEPKEMKVNPKEMAPDVPSKNQHLDGESDTYSSEKTTTVDGNQGQPHAAKSKKPEKIANQKKESGQKTVNRVKSLEDDPDIGQVKSDKAHSLAVDEKKPSEGVHEPEVPEAPNGGRLSREHTVEKPEGKATVATEGKLGRDEENEKNLPEKIDQSLGKTNDAQALASHRSRAEKIAGRMLKANMIGIDDLPAKIAELSKASGMVLDDYERMIVAGNQGLTKEAQVGATENLGVQTKVDAVEPEGNLRTSIQELFSLDKKNKDYERNSKE
jgi:hypothetical protein